MKNPQAIHNDPLNSALRLWPCVWSLHDAEGHLLSLIATESPDIIRHQFAVWDAHIRGGGNVIQWNHGRPAVSYGER